MAKKSSARRSAPNLNLPKRPAPRQRAPRQSAQQSARKSAQQSIRKSARHGEPFLSGPAVAAIAAIGIPLLLLGGLFAWWRTDVSGIENQVARGVTFDGTDLSGASITEAQAAVDDLAARFDSLPVTIEGPDDIRVSTNAQELGLTLDRQATFDQIMSTRRDTDPISWVGSFLSSEEVDAQVRLNLEASAPAVNRLAEIVQTDVGPPDMELRDGQLVGIPGEPGRALDRDGLLTLLEGDLPDPNTEALTLRAPTITVAGGREEGELLQFVDRLNAATLSPIRVTAAGVTRSFESAELRSWLRIDSLDPLTAGIDNEAVQAAVFDRFGEENTQPDLSSLTIVDGRPTLADGAPQRCCAAAGPVILEAIENRETTVELPLIDGGDEALTQLGVVELIGTFTTEHPANQSRVTNIQRMADLVRGQLIEPGETFSINDFVGRRTTSNGFVEAGVIIYGIIGTDVGGGVSQFATTMFNAAYESGLDIDDYTMHSIHFDRYPRGREATLDFPSIDLRVTNPSPYNVLLWTSYTPGSITVEFYSTTFADVVDMGTSESASGACAATRNTRQRTFLTGSQEGETVSDTFTAVYQPQEGVDCNGNSTLPQIDCPVGQQAYDSDDDLIDDSCRTVASTCGAGETPLDTNGDGVADFCDVAPLTCPEGFQLVDTDADGVGDSCDGVGVSCPAGSTAVDTNADGVPDSCQTEVPTCPAGTQLVDTNGDGAGDSCQTLAVSCAAGSTGVDTNADGVPDTCVVDQPQPVTCAAGDTPADTTGNGIADTCISPSVPTAVQTSVCGAGFQDVDTNGDGVIDQCQAL